MDSLEYLASYGHNGDFGRFRASAPLPCARGERVVVRSHRGLEIARVLRAAHAQHAAFLPNTTVGQLLRRANPEDDQADQHSRDRGRQLFERARGLACEKSLPLEVLDAEVLLDGSHGVVQLLQAAACDVRPFVSALAREFDLHILLSDLRPPASPAEDEPAPGCGSCGSDGGCGSCGSGGCGSCAAAPAAASRAHFADLREQMEQRRTPLL